MNILMMSASSKRHLLQVLIRFKSAATVMLTLLFLIQLIILKTTFATEPHLHNGRYLNKFNMRAEIPILIDWHQLLRPCNRFYVLAHSMT